MPKTLLVILGAKYNRDKITNFFDKSQKINHWFFSLPYSIFVTTELTPRQLMELIEKEFGEDRIFVTEITNSCWGRLPEDQWGNFKS
jgi:hypothetical protein